MLFRSNSNSSTSSTVSSGSNNSATGSSAAINNKLPKTGHEASSLPKTGPVDDVLAVVAGAGLLGLGVAYVKSRRLI